MLPNRIVSLFPFDNKDAEKPVDETIYEVGDSLLLSLRKKKLSFIKFCLGLGERPFASPRAGTSLRCIYCEKPAFDDFLAGGINPGRNFFSSREAVSTIMGASARITRTRPYFSVPRQSTTVPKATFFRAAVDGGRVWRESVAAL